MASTLQALRQALGLQLDDGYTSSLSSIGAADGTTIVDTDLKNYQSDWYSDGASGDQMTWIKLTSGTYSGQNRAFSSYTAASGTITVKTAFGGQVASAVTYELHRIWTPAEKDNAIVYGCRVAFPAVYKKVDDFSIRFGSWIRDGGFVVWTTTTNLTYWNESTTTCTQTTTAPNIYRPGSTSVALSAGAGYLSQRATENPDLVFLSEKTVTFKAMVKASTASQVRLRILDGTTTTTGSYHTGGGGWEEIEVKATIKESPNAPEFRILYDVTDTTAYVDEAWIEGAGEKYDYDISGLGLYNNCPHQVIRIDEENDAIEEVLRDWVAPSTDGKLRFKRNIGDGEPLRIIGMGQLTTPTSSVSTEVDEPQVQIILAEAAVYLCRLKLQKTNVQEVGRWAELVRFWESEARQRRAKFMMAQPLITLHW